MTVLADTSIWAEYLRRGKEAKAARLDDLLVADLGSVQWQGVGETAARLRERGETIALTNIEIAVAAVDSSSRLWTRDSDFKRVRGALPALRFFDP
ncbi:MAG: hypothetical protein ACP5PM_02675 [Acidimicrobiales bacterium]